MKHALTQYWLRMFLSVSAAMFLLCPSAHSQDLIQVDGVTPQCVHNQPKQVQHPGPGTLFPSPQYGYCNGTVDHQCATGIDRNLPGATAFIAIPTACVGTFTSWAQLQAQQASSIASLQDQLQKQLNILEANIKTLSDANDALTKRLNEVEAKLKKQDEGK